MPVEIWLAYVGTVVALMSTPGPSHVLILSNSLSNGFPRATATIAGDLTANMLQMLAAGLGVAALVSRYASALTVIKWLGAAYLVWLGISMIRRGATGVGEVGHEQRPLHTLWLQGFVTSATNPKAIVFFAAVFTQFIDPGLAFWPQFVALSLTYIVMDGFVLTLYGTGAHWVASHMEGPGRILLNRVAGGFMIIAALLLALKTLSHS